MSRYLFFRMKNISPKINFTGLLFVLGVVYKMKVAKPALQRIGGTYSLRSEIWQ